MIDRIIHPKIGREFNLVIIDDMFPSTYSPFRYEEYIEYIKKFYNVYVLTTGESLKFANEKATLPELVKNFQNQYPDQKSKIFDMNMMEYKEAIAKIDKGIAIITFIHNLCGSKYNNLKFLEENNIPFIFTLYPGGGFSVNDEQCKEKLKKIFSSKCFRKVIVTQKLTYDYLIQNKLCKEENIEFIYGIVTPQVIINKKIDKKRRDVCTKEFLDVCFVAHKYSEKGLDKGYDLLIDSAKKILKDGYNIKFHIIGEFSPQDIDIEDIKEYITFYGVRTSDWLKDFYKNMDIIVSPTRPFVLSEGSFDGFPTGACTEAMINEVLLLCSDELKLNIRFKDKNEIVIIENKTEDIVNKLKYYYNNRKELLKIAKRGSKKARKIYSYKKQITRRIKLINSVAKKEYKNI